jgi:hypothetical protein
MVDKNGEARDPSARGDIGFSKALELVVALEVTIASLEADRTTTLALLREALTTGGQYRRGLLLLQVMHTDFTVALADVLAGRALSTGHTSLVRRLFARLPRDEQMGVVPTAVWRQLAETDDGDAYARMAELLRYLGLDDALEQLAVAAAASDDPDVRDVGRAVRPDVATDGSVG